MGGSLESSLPHHNGSENGFSSYPRGTMPFTTKQTLIQHDPYPTRPRHGVRHPGYHPTTPTLPRIVRTHCPNRCHHIADIGTGSGILTIAAIKLGAKRVDAIEIDPRAIPVAAANFQTNAVTSQVCLSQNDGLKEVDSKYHLIIGNILTKTILPIIPECAPRLHPAGIVIFSGILETELAQVQSVLEANQFECLQVISEAEDKNHLGRNQSETPISNQGRPDLKPHIKPR